MRHYTTILTFIILTAFLACSDSQFSDKNIETKAINITEQLDSNTIKIFREWNFFKRGVDFWVKVSNNNEQYTCNYYSINDTAFLVIPQPYKFITDFPSNFDFDTAQYWRFELSNYNDKVNIVGVDNNGRDKIIATMLSLDSLFPTTNPFEKFSMLSALKDSLGVYGISYHKDIGDFIQFYLSAQHVLTYIPENLFLNPKFKDVWLKKFKKGQTIKSNWNLRKLDQPIDNG